MTRLDHLIERAAGFDDWTDVEQMRALRDQLADTIVRFLQLAPKATLDRARAYRDRFARHLSIVDVPIPAENPLAKIPPCFECDSGSLLVGSGSQLGVEVILVVCASCKAVRTYAVSTEGLQPLEVEPRIKTPYR